MDQTATNTAATAKDDDEQDEADSEAESTDANLTLSPNAVFNYWNFSHNIPSPQSKGSPLKVTDLKDEGKFYGRIFSG